MRRGALLVGLVLLAAACSGSSGPPSASGSIPATTPPTSSPTVGSQALVSSLPSGCNKGTPKATATVAFVAQGRAWAVSPDGTGLTCLFKVSDPGPFEWGPRADRVLLGGLEIRGVGSNASRPSGSLQPISPSWGRPSGSAVVFVDPQGRKLEKAAVGSTKVEDVTPAEQEGHFPSHVDVSFQQVIYHPSGRALGFVLTHRIEGSAIYVSSNRGEDPHRLVWSKSGTVFGPIAFGLDGKALYYVAHLANGTRMISQADLGQGRITTGLWTDKQDVLQLLIAPSGRAAAIDTGTSCDDRTAVLSNFDQTKGAALLPGATGATSVIGWVDDSTVLVGEGGCDGSMKLWRVQVGSGGATLVVDGVDQAAVRVPDPTPTPPLPKIPVKTEFA